MTTKHADDFKKYSYNNQANGSSPYYVSLTHQYINRCYLIDKARWVMLVLGIINSIVSFVWIYFVWNKWGQNSQTSLQKWLVIIPLSTAIY
jgi:hypothetical protein